MSFQEFQLYKAVRATAAKTATNNVQVIPATNATPATPATPATNATNNALCSKISGCSRPGLVQPKKSELHYEDIMKLPIRPCTTCAQLEWVDRDYEREDGSIRTYRVRECQHYGKSIADPRRGCRCIRFESKWSTH